MKKALFILGMVAALMAPAILPAVEENTVVDPMMGAVKFGEHEDSTELVWKSGRIEDIDETGIRVNDLGYRFIPDTKFYSASGVTLTRLNFHVGDEVKFVIRREPKTGYRMTIVSLVKAK